MDKLLQKPETSFKIVYSVDDNFDSESFIKLRLRVCHDGVSPNKTYFTKEVMEDAKETIKNKPILAHVKYDDDGMPMFGSHDMRIEKNRLRDGEDKVIYEEVPIGVIPEDCNFTIEEFDGKNYVFVDGYVFRDYANYAEELIEDAVNTKLSMEISIPDDALSYNAKEHYWEITKFKFRGITMLNENLGTGMKNALATTENFSLENAEKNIKERMIILMEALQDCLSNYNKENLNKGGNGLTKFEELLQKYNLTIDDVTFEYEGLSDDELEAKFEEVFSNSDEPNLSTDNSNENFEDTQINTDKLDGVHATEKFVKSFEISHEDIRYALYNLLTTYEDADDDYYYIMNVYDNKFEYQGWINSKIYRQGYIKDGDNVSFDGERIELYQELLTASEKAELESLRSNYEALSNFKTEYEKVQKKEIFDSEKYSVLADNKDFIALKKDAEKYSVKEIERECKVIFADYVLSLEEFSLTDETKSNKLNIPMNQDEVKKPYGGYFDKYVSNTKN